MALVGECFIGCNNYRAYWATGENVILEYGLLLEILPNHCQGAMIMQTSNLQ
jgi:hypothetical protein